MRIRPSKNDQAVASAIALFNAEEDARPTATPVRGPRGIVNARRLGLSWNPRARARPAGKHPRGSERKNAAILTPAHRRGGCVRGKHVPLKPKGYARKEYRAAEREIAHVLDQAIANQPRLRRKRDKMIQAALSQVMRGRPIGARGRAR